MLIYIHIKDKTIITVSYRHGDNAATTSCSSLTFDKLNTLGSNDNGSNDKPTVYGLYMDD